MNILKTYTENRIEFEKDSYYNNNTALTCDDQTPYHYYDSGQSIFLAAVEYNLYKLNEDQLRLGVIDESLIDTFTASTNGSVVYLEPQSFAREGIYRFHITYNGITVYTDIFCIKSITYGSIEMQKSGLLRFYKGDYFEYQKDGYFKNNTLIKMDTQISGFYFDSELSISTITAKLYQVDKGLLKVKTMSDHEIKSITPNESGSLIYMNDDYFEGSGIYRYLITVTPTVGSDVDFYSDCFCVTSPPQTILSLAQFADETYIQFANGEFMEFTT